MLHSYLVGLALVVAAATLWAAVQMAWRRVFADLVSDPDALAARRGSGSGCGGCGCTTICERQVSGPGPAAEEEER